MVKWKKMGPFHLEKSQPETHEQFYLLSFIFITQVVHIHGKKKKITM